MKIAITSSNDKERENLIKKFISNWNMYATPAENIFQETKWPEDADIKELNDLKDKFNDVEKELYSKLFLLIKQYDDYKDVKHIIFNGSPSDILVHSLILCEQGVVKPEFVEKVIIIHKKLLQKLDVIYWIPNNEVTNESSEDIKHLENVYINLYDNYQTEFNESPFFDHKDCCSYLLLDTDNQIAEIKLLIDKNGNLGTTEHGDELMNLESIKKALGNDPQLIEAAMKSLKNPNIVGGAFQGSLIIES